MKAKILILALCAFQLAAGDIFSDMISAPMSAVTGFFNGAMGQASSISQSFQDLFQSFSGNISSAISFGLSQFNSSQNDSCRNNQTQQLYALGNQTVNLFRAGASIVNETIRNGSYILTNVSSAIANAIPQAIANYSACLSSGGGGGGGGGGIFGFFTSFVSSVSSPFTCATRVATQQFSLFANTTNTQIQSALQILNQTLSPSNMNSSIHTIPQLADLGANLTATVAAQAAAIGLQAMACAAQTAGSVAAAFSG